MSRIVIASSKKTKAAKAKSLKKATSREVGVTRKIEYCGNYSCPFAIGWNMGGESCIYCMSNGRLSNEDIDEVHEEQLYDEY